MHSPKKTLTLITSGHFFAGFITKERKERGEKKEKDGCRVGIKKINRLLV